MAFDVGIQPITAQQQDMQNLVQQLGGVSADPEKRAALEQQMALAKQLRSLPGDMPQGQDIHGFLGGVYVPPNPLQDIAQAGMNYKAMQSDANALQQSRAMAAKEEGARTAMLAQIFRQMYGGTGGGGYSDQSQDNLPPGYMDDSTQITD